MERHVPADVVRSVFSVAFRVLMSPPQSQPRIRMHLCVFVCMCMHGSVFVCAYLCGGQNPVRRSKGEPRDILMSTFQWKGEGMEQVWNFLILSQLVPFDSRLHTLANAHTTMLTRAVLASKHVIVPAGVTRCTTLFWAFIQSSGEFVTPSLSQVSPAPSLPIITSEPKASQLTAPPPPSCCLSHPSCSQQQWQEPAALLRRSGP